MGVLGLEILLDQVEVHVLDIQELLLLLIQFGL